MKLNMANLHNSFDLELKPHYYEHLLEVMHLLTGLIQKILHCIEETNPKLDNIISTTGIDETVSTLRRGLEGAEQMCLSR